VKQNLLERAEQLGLPPRSAVVHLDRSSSPFLNSPFSPLRIALLGCGTVGGGVLHHLLARPGLFQVTGVLVRDLFRDRGGLPRHLFTTDTDELLGRDTDVVVELLGGREPAGRLIREALALGRHVVTANKALLAETIDPLSELAARSGAFLLFSASVGGALPALETVRRAAALGRIRAISGVLNGTCNFVLDRCLAGSSFEEAVAEAQAAGYAEADPTLDLDGSDTAQKLALLIREAFGVPLSWQEIPRQGIAEPPPGKTVRLVATCERTTDGLAASVRPVELPADHFFARATGTGNALRIEMEDGSRTELTAQGAGRWPTSASVLADLQDLRGLLAARPAFVEVAL
jgi:homoserine dehydrogenase